MTHEQRLDRLERIAKLFVRAGLRARSEARKQDEKINILIDKQIRNDEKFAAHEEKFANQDKKINILIDAQIRHDERSVAHEGRFANHDETIKVLLDLQRKNEERFAQNEVRFAELAESQANISRRFDSLIELLREDRNGNSKPNS